MPARVFATLAQYRDWTGDQSATVTPQQLASASRLVSAAIVGAEYDYDSITGMPLGAEVLEAVMEATCAVVQYRAPAAAVSEMAAAGIKSAKIGTATYEVSDDAAAVDMTALPVEAHRILDEAGLVGGPVYVYG